MEPTTLGGESDSPEIRSHKLFERFVVLNQHFMSKGLSVEDLKSPKSDRKFESGYLGSIHKLGLVCTVTIIISLIVSTVFRLPFIDGMMKSALGIKCVLPNNYLVWEATRPVADCSICRGVNSVLILPNVTREEFQRYAYSYRPMLVKGAAAHWPAARTFTFRFFKNLFENTEGSYESVEEECQFLNFKSDFHSLRDVFAMPPERSGFSPGEKPWYIGWSNCHPKILEEMRSDYDKPHFLPSDAEHSHVDYVFMGFQQGAFMHLDYISRLMWQAQLQGHKTWRLNPPPECEDLCQSFSFTVHPGDILLLDTRQWYHDTHVEGPAEFSLTVSSEYG